MSLENSIASDFLHGPGLSIGIGNLIEENVKVGDKVTIKNFVELRSGTRIGNGCYIDSRVSTSGGSICRIGDNVTLRYAAIIARNVIIEDNVFISPQVGFINIPFTDKIAGKPTIIKKGALIGFNATIREGITIAEGVIVGAKANVTRDLLKAGTYVGNPARLIEKKSSKVTMGKNIIIEKGAIIGAQPFLFTRKGELINPSAGVTIKDNVWVGSNTTIMNGKERDTYIGKNVKIAQLCNIGHDSIIEDGVRISAGSVTGGYSEIGKRAYVGLGVKIRERVRIGSCTLIGMGSNVVSNIPDNVIAYGNPCKVVSKRFKLMSYYLRRLI